jgi:hypothetical protein
MCAQGCNRVDNVCPYLPDQVQQLLLQQEQHLERGPGLKRLHINTRVTRKEDLYNKM